MNIIVKLLCPTSLLIVSCLTMGQTVPDHPLAWAYPWLLPSEKISSEVNPDSILNVTDSDRTFTYRQTKDPFFSPDWHPEEHPVMPDIVKYGRRPDVVACGVCHRADGSGGPENASLNGLSSDYVIEQLAAFKSDQRKQAFLPDLGPGIWMHRIARVISDEELKVAAEYFASINPRNNIEVIEAVLIPKVKVNGTFYSYLKTDEKELLGNRIIEGPNDIEQFEKRDTRSRFTAYVPVGSIDRGKRLAEAIDSQKTMRCASCHGSGLKGVGVIPRLAGRSPTYITRQLFDIQTGSRTGDKIAPMLAVVEKLTPDDMISLAAYISSLSP